MTAGTPEDATIRQGIRAALEARPEVLFAYLFGSRAAGRPHAASDVDVAVYLRPTDGGAQSDEEGVARRDGPAAWPEIHGDLVDALAPRVPGVGLRQGGHAPEGVDLVVLNDAPPLLADRVVREGELVLSRSERARIRWTVRVKSRYCDLQPLRRRLDRALEERLRSGRFGRRTSRASADRVEGARDAGTGGASGSGQGSASDTAQEESP